MSLLITDECINCGACEECCPTSAITEDDEQTIRVINPELCTECVGFYARTMCQVECPIECCLPHPGHRETKGQLIEKAKRLFPDQDFPEPPPSHIK